MTEAEAYLPGNEQISTTATTTGGCVRSNHGTNDDNDNNNYEDSNSTHTETTHTKTKHTQRRQRMRLTAYTGHSTTATTTGRVRALEPRRER